MGTVVERLAAPQDIEHAIRFAAVPVDLASSTVRQRVLLISTWHPVPADNGRKQRTLGLIAALRDDYDVVLVSLLPEDACDAGRHDDVPGVCRTEILPLPEFNPRSYRALAGGLRRRPRSVVATWNSATAAAIVALARTTGALLAIGTDLRSLEYLRYLRSQVDGIATILDEPDVSPFAETDLAESPVASLRSRLRRRKYVNYLTDAAGDLDAILVAADHEVRSYRALSGGDDAVVIPNGVQRFPGPWSPPGTSGLLYTGSLTYEPNLEAVAWYERSILPLLRTQLPLPVLHVTGTLPDSIPEVLKQPAFRLTGRVDDLDPFYRAAGAFVAPILSGTGTRVKILEAMAIGMPIVTTSKGCEGIPLVPGDHALVADTPEAFTLAIMRVLRDEVFAQTLGARARAFVKQHFDWNLSAEQFRVIVADLLARGR